MFIDFYISSIKNCEYPKLWSYPVSIIITNLVVLRTFKDANTYLYVFALMAPVLELIHEDRCYEEHPIYKISMVNYACRA